MNRIAHLSRRAFLKNKCAATALPPWRATLPQNRPNHRHGIAVATGANHHSGPKFHWFGYYDKLQFDPDEPIRPGDGGGFRAPLAQDPTTYHQNGHG